MSDTIHDRDTLLVRVPVAQEDGAVLDLTGATILALAGRAGTASVAGTVTVPAPATGVIEVRFAAAALSAGNWTVQVTVTLGPDTRTVTALPVTVLPSHPDP